MKKEADVLLSEMSMEEIREKYRPSDEPWRFTWDDLHHAHVRLLKRDGLQARRHEVRHLLRLAARKDAAKLGALAEW
jgi:hypothetical protein